MMTMRHAPPNAAIMIEALRGLGYNTATALADIIDNSISAITRFIGFSWLIKFNTGIRSRLSDEHASATPLPDLQRCGSKHTAPRDVQSGGRGVQRM